MEMVDSNISDVMSSRKIVELLRTSSWLVAVPTWVPARDLQVAELQQSKIFPAGNDSNLYYVLQESKKRHAKYSCILLAQSPQIQNIRINVMF